MSLKLGGNLQVLPCSHRAHFATRQACKAQVLPRMRWDAPLKGAEEAMRQWSIYAQARRVNLGGSFVCYIVCYICVIHLCVTIVCYIVLPRMRWDAARGAPMGNEAMRHLRSSESNLGNNGHYCITSAFADTFPVCRRDCKAITVIGGVSAFPQHYYYDTCLFEVIFSICLKTWQRLTKLWDLLVFPADGAEPVLALGEVSAVLAHPDVAAPANIIIRNIIIVQPLQILLLGLLLYCILSFFILHPLQIIFLGLWYCMIIMLHPLQISSLILFLGL